MKFNRENSSPILACILICLIYGLIPDTAFGQGKRKPSNLVITNFDKQGNQIIRYSTLGDAIDAHDGEIALFNDTYYLALVMIVDLNGVTKTRRFAALKFIHQETC